MALRQGPFFHKTAHPAREYGNYLLLSDLGHRLDGTVESTRSSDIEKSKRVTKYTLSSAFFFSLRGSLKHWEALDIWGLPANLDRRLLRAS
ncbi:hypothetical protein MPTK1_8g12050 [Marchantia polymorpha subsp. ruderalis]|nr:hypothetical protein Mp_8g12050 [Marchantia polymorpha subsp. ruderalis]